MATLELTPRQMAREIKKTDEAAQSEVDYLIEEAQR